MANKVLSLSLSLCLLRRCVKTGAACQCVRVVGTVDSVGSTSSSSSSSSSGVHAQLRQAVQLAMDQQQQLETLRGVVERQNKYISRLCRRDVTLGLELRQASSGTDRQTPTDNTSLTTSDYTGWWRGVAATRCVESTKLLYGGPG